MNRILWNERDAEIDEVVFTNPELVHIEQMSEKCWWIGVHLADGTYWAGNFHTHGQRRGFLTFTEQESDVTWDHDGSHDDTSRAVSDGSN